MINAVVDVSQGDKHSKDRYLYDYKNVCDFFLSFFCSFFLVFSFSFVIFIFFFNFLDTKPDKCPALRRGFCS